MQYLRPSAPFTNAGAALTITIKFSKELNNTDDKYRQNKKFRPASIRISGIYLFYFIRRQETTEGWYIAISTPKKNTIRMTTWLRMRWTEHEAYVCKKKAALMVLVGWNLKCTLVRTVLTWENNIQKDCKGIRWQCRWIQLPQDRKQRWTTV